jgi:NitT/TauT family transport system ATP-binding protein
MIQDLAFEILTGDFICLVGPPGAGKSALINMLSGLDSSPEWLDDGPGCVSYVFQDPRLMPWLIVRENIELVLHDAKAGRIWVVHLLRRVALVFN